MAAQHLTGKDGHVTVGGTRVNVTGWSFDPGVDLQETTNSGTSGFKTYEVGLAGATGQFSFDMPIGGALPTGITLGGEVALVLKYSTSLTCCTIARGLLHQLPIQSEVGGKIKVTCNFTVSGSFAIGS